MKTLFALTLIAITPLLTGCSTLAAGSIEGGRTNLTRDINTDAGREYTVRERTLRVGIPPAPEAPATSKTPNPKESGK